MGGCVAGVLAGGLSFGPVADGGGAAVVTGGGAGAEVGGDSTGTVAGGAGVAGTPGAGQKVTVTVDIGSERISNVSNLGRRQSITITSHQL